MTKDERNSKIISMAIAGNTNEIIANECDCSVRTVRRVLSENEITREISLNVQGEDKMSRDDKNDEFHITKDMWDSVLEQLDKALDTIDALTIKCDELSAKSASIDNINYNCKFKLHINSDNRDIYFNSLTEISDILKSYGYEYLIAKDNSIDRLTKDKPFSLNNLGYIERNSTYKLIDDNIISNYDIADIKVSLGNVIEELGLR